MQAQEKSSLLIFLFFQVFLGMIYENENDADGIIKILQKLHKFVPCDNKDNEEPVYGNQGVVGDQLTVERAINGHMSLSNGFSAEERIEGLHFEVADWHAGNKFLEVCHSLINHAGVGGSRLI